MSRGGKERPIFPSDLVITTLCQFFKAANGAEVGVDSTLSSWRLKVSGSPSPSYENVEVESSWVIGEAVAL